MKKSAISQQFWQKNLSGKKMVLQGFWSFLVFVGGCFVDRMWWIAWRRWFVGGRFFRRWIFAVFLDLFFRTTQG